MGQFTITPRAIKDEKGNWLVAIDIESTDKEKTIQKRALLTTEQATELCNAIKFATYTAITQNLKTD
jgi:hypothetical protein